MRYLFAAPLIFSALCVIKLPSQEALALASLDSPLSFLVSYLLAAALTLAICCLIPALRTTPLLHPPSLVCVLPVLAGVGLAFLFDVAGIGVAAQVPIGAALVGTGSALILLMWAQAFMSLTDRELVTTTIAAFLLAFLLKLAFDVLGASQTSLIIMGAAVVVSAIPLDSLSGRQSKDLAKPSVCPARTKTTPTSIVLRWWKPFFGCVICCMIWGFTWGNSLAGHPPEGLGTLSLVITDVGRILGGTCLLALSILRPSHRRAGLLIPLAIGLLLLGWIFSMVEGVAGTVAAKISSGIGFTLCEIAFWIKTCEISERSPARARLLFGISHALLSVVILSGIVLAPYTGVIGGELITPTFSIVFFILLATVPSTTSGALPTSLVHEMPSEGDPETSRPSLDALCSTYRLSPRETEVFLLFVHGHSAKYIAEELVVSLHTVKTHIKRIYEKMGVHSKDELIALADTPQDGQR